MALRQLSRSGKRALAGLRSYAAAPMVKVDEHGDSPFLRFASPVPQPQNMLPALGSIPETKVRLKGPSLLWSCIEQRNHASFYAVPILHPSCGT